MEHYAESARAGAPIPEIVAGMELAPSGAAIDWKRLGIIGLGAALFLGVYLSPPWPAAIDPQGAAVTLTRQGKATLGLFLLASTWWIGEVIPLGVTSIAIGVIQALFLIRDPKEVFGDFSDPSVFFIIGSLIIGMAFTKTGLTKRLAYKMLTVVGERAVMIYLGCFAMTALLTLFMAHTAVAATVFPLLMAIYSLYDENHSATRFGKGLFIGMAFSAGAGSVITLLGSARAAVALGFYKDMVGHEITFFHLTYYMLPLGLTVVVLVWLGICAAFPPERRSIPGLRQRAQALADSLGPVSAQERLSLVIVAGCIATLGLQAFAPALRPLNKSAVILVATLLFFLFRVLDQDDLETLSWNIVLLFGGAMCIGSCLWETGAAKWLAVKWLVLFAHAPRVVFLLALAVFILLVTNFIMNVAAIAITFPVAVVMGSYLGVGAEVILFVSLTAAGMPFLSLIGAAPNAIAYGSRQFTAREFFLVGLPMTIVVVLVLALFLTVVWPLMGLPVLNG